MFGGFVLSDQAEGPGPVARPGKAGLIFGMVYKKVYSIWNISFSKLGKHNCIPE